MHRIIRSFAIGMFFIMPLLSESAMAAVESASWGQLKAQVVDHQPQPAGKMVTSRAVAGNRNLQGRQDTFHPRYSAGLYVEVLDAEPLEVVADASNGGDDGAQALVPFLRLRFSAGGRDATVYEIKFKRSGFSSDRDVSGLYLYQGDGVADNLIAESRSFHNRVVAFSKGGGLFTVPAEGYTDLVLRGDIADDVSGGRTMSFSVTSAADIIVDGAAPAGAFPLEGPTARTNTVSDLGYVTVANVSPTGASIVSPGTRDFPRWRFSLSATDQDMEVRFLRITMAGSAGHADISNFRLMADGAVAAEAAAMNEDREIVFVFAHPLVLREGRTINIDLLVDVAPGASGTTHFQLQRSTDVVVYDRYYEVYAKPNRRDVWIIIESNSPTTYTIIGDTRPEELPQAGKLTISLADDSPTGTMVAGATNVVLAQFIATAQGEDIGIKSLSVTAPSVLNGINNVRVYYNGVQMGATSDIDAANDDAEFYFGIGGDFAVRDGIPGVIEIRGDAKNAAGIRFSTSELVTISLAAGSNNAYGLTSRLSVSTPSVAGADLTVVTGSLLVARGSFSDASADNPWGVAGQSRMLLGSFVITAGIGEGSSIYDIVLTDDVGRLPGQSLADAFQNLWLESAGQVDANGNYQSGVVIGAPIGTLTDVQDMVYHFRPSPALELSAGKRIAVHVYGDVKPSATNNDLTVINEDGDGIVYPSIVSAVGLTTGNTTNGSMHSGLQHVHITLRGDVRRDGEINSADSQLVLRYLAGVEELTPAQLAVADMNNDGSITEADAVAILEEATRQ